MPFQLYKKRTFGDYMNNVIDFFKQYGKNYLKNFVVINGSVMLVLCVLFYFTVKDMFSNLGNDAYYDQWFENENNIITMVVLFGLFLIVAVIYGIVSSCYPFVYLKLLESSDKDEFTADELFKSMMKNVGRMFKFGFYSMFILMPIMFVIALLGSLLSIVIIGIGILAIALPAFMVWAFQAMIIYVFDEESYFDALGKGWRVLFSDFWPITGATVVMYILVALIQGAVTFVPAIIMMVAMLSNGDPSESTGTIAVIYIITYILALIVGFFLSNAIYIQQGMIYYSSKEDFEHENAFSEIDSIGSDNEM